VIVELMGLRISDPHPIPPGAGRVHLIKDGHDETDEGIEHHCACCGHDFQASGMHRCRDGHIGSRCIHCAELQTIRQKQLSALKKKKGKK